MVVTLGPFMHENQAAPATAQSLLLVTSHPTWEYSSSIVLGGVADASTLHNIGSRPAALPLTYSQALYFPISDLVTIRSLSRVPLLRLFP
jgi:hypothetical protein